jgi:hypothetical protein
MHELDLWRKVSVKDFPLRKTQYPPFRQRAHRTGLDLNADPDLQDLDGDIQSSENSEYESEDGRGRDELGEEEGEEQDENEGEGEEEAGEEDELEEEGELEEEDDLDTLDILDVSTRSNTPAD